MTTQPKPLRLADALENKAIVGNATVLELGAAAELRRLYEQNEAMAETSSQVIADNVRLAGEIDELVEGLKEVTSDFSVAGMDAAFAAHQKARALIAKHQGETQDEQATRSPAAG